MGQEMLQKIGEVLSDSLYKLDSCEKYGNTGVDEDRFKHEMLFEKNFGSASVIKAEDYGVIAGTKEDMRIKLQEVINEVKKLGDIDKVLVLPEGEIYIYDDLEKTNTYALDLQGIKNLTVEGGATHFLLDMTTRGIRVEECENIVLREMTFDRFDLPYFTGTVEKMDAEKQYALLNIYDEYEPEDPYPVREYLEFNEKDKTPRYHGNFLYNNLEVDVLVEMIKGVNITGDHKARIDFSWDITEAPEGCGYVITKTMYGIDTIAIIKSKNIYTENVSIYCTPGMGIRGYSSEDVYMNRTNVMLKPESNRYMTVTADAMHFMDCKGDLVMTNCLMENSHDDAINIHGMFQMIIDVDKENKRYKMLCGRTAKFEEPKKDDEITIPFEVGDEIEVSEDDTLKLITTVHVDTVEEAEDYGFWVTFEEDTDFENGLLMCNVTRSPKVLIDNCMFRNKRNRGVLLQSRHSAIKNCTFYNVLMPAICLVADCQNWHEGINGKDILIENNRFINTNLIKNNFKKLGNGDIDIAVYSKYGAINAGLIGDVKIRGNAFINSGGNCISAQSLKRSEISDNLFYRCGSEIPKEKRDPIVQGYTEELNIRSNDIVAR